MKFLKELLLNSEEHICEESHICSFRLLNFNYQICLIDEANVSIVSNGLDKLLETKEEGFFKRTTNSVIQTLKNPIVAGIATVWALDSYKKFKNKLHNTVRFYAKSYEKKIYEKIIEDLMKTGHYKKIKSEYSSDGYMWELQRKG